MTGQNGGGLFVLVYLVCVAVVGMPIMLAEIFIGRTAQNSPVGAYRTLSAPTSPWLAMGWLNVLTAFFILSFYSVVGGWGLEYLWLSVTDGFADKTPEQIEPMFGELTQNGRRCALWHMVFMVLTTGIVAAGVKGGIELCARILMPMLFVLLLILVVWGTTTDGFVPGLKYVIGIRDDQVMGYLQEDPGGFTSSSWLAALGQAFFSLSLGMGALITYGSYLKRDEDIVSTSIIVGGLDTLVAILAALLMFPILFSAGLGPNQEEGLAFISLPIAFSQMPGGSILAPVFFLLLTFAALTSSISLLEVATSYFIDERKWSRAKSALLAGGVILVLGIPSALSFTEGGLFSTGMRSATSKIFGEAGEMSWLGVFVYATFKLFLPLGGLGIATFVAWRVGGRAREESFKVGSRLGRLYWGWVYLLRFVVPIAVIAVLLHAIGVI
jgi:NSS family neurotransmitter:Na+ symporter